MGCEMFKYDIDSNIVNWVVLLAIRQHASYILSLHKLVHYAFFMKRWGLKYDYKVGLIDGFTTVSRICSGLNVKLNSSIAGGPMNIVRHGVNTAFYYKWRGNEWNGEEMKEKEIVESWM